MSKTLSDATPNVFQIENGEKMKHPIDNVKSSFTKRQVMFPVFLALCFISKMLRLLFFIFYVIHILNLGQLDLSSKNLYSFQ